MDSMYQFQTAEVSQALLQVGFVSNHRPLQLNPVTPVCHLSIKIAVVQA